MISANTVADFFLSFAHEHGDYITPLKLQKLVYYADAWHLVNFDEALVDEDFEAWIHGPVVRSLYTRFKDYRWNPILCEVTKPQLPSEIEEHLHETYEAFGGFSGFELERMTHEEKPWIDARKGYEPDDSCGVIINKQTMRDFYTASALEA